MGSSVSLDYDSETEDCHNGDEESVATIEFDTEQLPLHPISEYGLFCYLLFYEIPTEYCESQELEDLINDKAHVLEHLTKNKN